jgi:hypothetical protein
MPELHSANYGGPDEGPPNLTSSYNQETFTSFSSEVLELVMNNLSALVEITAKKDLDKAHHVLSLLDVLKDVKIVPDDKIDKNELVITTSTVRMQPKIRTERARNTTAYMVLECLVTLLSAREMKNSLSPSELKSLYDSSKTHAADLAEDLKVEKKPFALAGQVLEDQIAEILAPQNEEEIEAQKQLKEAIAADSDAKYQELVRSGKVQATLDKDLTFRKSSILRNLSRWGGKESILNCWHYFAPMLDRTFAMSFKETRIDQLCKDLAGIINVVGAVWVVDHKKFRAANLASIAPPKDIKDAIDMSTEILKRYIYMRHFSDMDMGNLQRQFFEAAEKLHPNPELFSFLRISSAASDIKNNISQFELSIGKALEFREKDGAVHGGNTSIQTALLSAVSTPPGGQLALEGGKVLALGFAGREEGKDRGVTTDKPSSPANFWPAVAKSAAEFTPEAGSLSVVQMNIMIQQVFDLSKTRREIPRNIPALFAEATINSLSNSPAPEKWFLYCLNAVKTPVSAGVPNNIHATWEKFAKKTGLLSAKKREEYAKHLVSLNPDVKMEDTDDIISYGTLLGVLLFGVVQSESGDNIKYTALQNSAQKAFQAMSGMAGGTQIAIITSAIFNTLIGEIKQEAAAGEAKAAIASPKGSGGGTFTAIKERVTNTLGSLGGKKEPTFEQRLEKVAGGGSFNDLIARITTEGRYVLDHLQRLTLTEQSKVIRIIIGGADSKTAWDTAVRDLSRKGHGDNLLKWDESLRPSLKEMYNSVQALQGLLTGRTDFNGKEAISLFAKLIENVEQFNILSKELEVNKKEEKENQLSEILQLMRTMAEDIADIKKSLQEKKD